MRQKPVNSLQINCCLSGFSPVTNHSNVVLPVELVESQFDLWGVRLPVATPVTEDLLDAPDAERLGSIQVWPLDVVWWLPVIFWIQLLIHIFLPMGTLHWTCWLHTERRQNNVMSLRHIPNHTSLKKFKVLNQVPHPKLNESGGR